MSAKDQIRQKLDELMGTGWDGAKNSMHYSHPKVCRCFLLGLCPHDALAGTKMSMGICPKIHDYALKADYENSSKTVRSSQHHFYELTVLTYLQKVIRSCESINQAKKGRLARCKSNSWNVRIVDKEAEMKSYNDMVDKKLIEAEELGYQGKVQEALSVIKEVERLKRRRSRLEKYLVRKPREPAKEQKHNICEECQLCIGLDDNEQRVANHSSGRLHKAMLAIRTKIVDLANSLERAQESANRSGLDATQQPARPTTRLNLASTRAGSHSRERRSRSRSRRRSYSSDCSSSDYSSRSRSNSRYKPHSRSRSRSRYRHFARRSRSGSSYSRGSRSSRSRSSSSGRYSRSYSRGRSYSRSYSRSRSRSLSRCRSRRRSRSWSHHSKTRSRSRSYSTPRHRYRGERSHRSWSTCSSRTPRSDSENEDRGEIPTSQGPEGESMKGEQAIETEAQFLTGELAHSTMSEGPAAVDIAANPHASEVSTLLDSAPMSEEQSLSQLRKIPDFRVQLGAEEEKTDPALETKRVSLPAAGTPQVEMQSKQSSPGDSSSLDEDSSFEEQPADMHCKASLKKTGISFESFRFFNATRRLRKGKARQRTVDNQIETTAIKNATDSKAPMDEYLPAPGLPKADKPLIADGHLTKPNQQGQSHQVFTRHERRPGEESSRQDPPHARNDTIEQEPMQSSAGEPSQAVAERQQTNSCIRSF